jgi:fumarate hydratase subunit beta
MSQVEHRIFTLPLSSEQRTELAALDAGTEVRLNGTVYVARDQAHKRMIEDLEQGRELPFEIKDAVIFYMGPSPAPEGRVIGAAGPTTSARMDPFTPALLDRGLAAMIGKGPRSAEVVESIQLNNAVYFYAFGGCGALYASRIIESDVIAYEDLGPEAVRRLKIQDFPVLLAIDSKGGSVFS